jgi:aspartyl-tRNA(Asn)/glutamyl-tRNA(Gln) amidotransferase subunit B
MLVYLEICDGNMQEGSFRCDANVSIRPVGETYLGVKTELKNMNSFRNVQKGLQYEIYRQIEVLQANGRIVQDTRLFDPSTGATVSMRSKEQAHDYRYFPDPDLLPLRVAPQLVEKLRNKLPELPAEKRMRFVKDFEIPPYDSGVLTSSRRLAEFFEEVVALYPNAKPVSNLLMIDPTESGISRITPGQVASLLALVDNSTISGTVAKTIYEEMRATGKNAADIVREKGLGQVSDTEELLQIVRKVLDENPTEVGKYLGGKSQLLGFFVGQVMKATKGKGNPKIVNRILTEELTKRAD